MTPAMQAARDRVVEAARRYAVAFGDSSIANDSPVLVSLVDRLIGAVIALEAQEKEQADAEG